jgi:hypothetical protein
MSMANARPGTYALVLAAVKRQTVSVGKLDKGQWPCGHAADY